MADPTRILVVEDDEDVARLVQLHLERAGYRVSVAPDGHSALDEVFSLGTDLVLLDIRLPHMDGWEVCRRLRSVSALPIIILTACAQAHDRVKGLSLGADDYVCKPFNARELLARIQALLSRKDTAAASIGFAPSYAGG